MSAAHPGPQGLRLKRHCKDNKLNGKRETKREKLSYK